MIKNNSAIREDIARQIFINLVTAKQYEQYELCYALQYAFMCADAYADYVANLLPVNNEQGTSPDNAAAKVVFEHWNSCSVVVHKSLDDKTKRAIIAALNQHELDYILKAISNYAFVYKSPEHFFKYKWTLHDFMKRGILKFADEADPINNFKRNKDTMHDINKSAKEVYTSAKELYQKKYNI